MFVDVVVFLFSVFILNLQLQVVKLKIGQKKKIYLVPNLYKFGCSLYPKEAICNILRILYGMEPQTAFVTSVTSRG